MRKQGRPGKENAGGKILVIAGDGGESYETWYGVHRLQEAGYEPVVAASSKRELNLVTHDFPPGWDTYRERPGCNMESDVAFARVKVADYAAVLCIGGRAPEYLRNDPKVLAILREFDARKKWIFALCHGVQLPAAAGLLRGRNATCYEHVRHEVEAGGGVYKKKPVVRDGRLVTAPTWGEHPDFYREVFACLDGAARG